jgi:hypothetical protein
MKTALARKYAYVYYISRNIVILLGSFKLIFTFVGESNSKTFTGANTHKKPTLLKEIRTRN